MGKEPIDTTPASAEVVARVQTISDKKALKRHFSAMFKQGQPHYADFYDIDAEPWNLWPGMVSDFVEGWEPITFDDGRKPAAIAMALTLSMSAGTDAVGNQGAALALARREFGDREHVWVAGDHNGPFVKFLVQYRNEEGRPLSPGPSDLRRYRETYAEELCARDITARATTRGSRGLGFSEGRLALKARRRLSGS
ncbi:hypothetical protein HL653_23930 (plasmid) [Sphingomonas sp. AP4-R1]|uniref:hypothetical protein n=1 Tax=Sphingomonas sp. AP4-R1 TaxID=2735134 RepID=UPI001493C421|nr:hypothetical protein [Sphingomonas sp. AP4-R1]QJU60963.1 hypothetical protein HL653_23930 [Sphingomonas sp. AP4-R1]